MNLKELSQLAGVSISTVSKSLNNSPEISEKTKKRIKTLAEENGFFLSPHARSVKKRKNNCIAIVFSRKTFFDPYTTLLCTTLQELLMREIEKQNYSYIINVSRDSNGQSMIKNIFHQDIVDGFILASDDITDDEITFLQKHNFPFVFYGITPKFLPDNVNYFRDDDFRGGYDSTKYLIDLGFKKITTISNTQNFDGQFDDYRLRTEGYTTAMLESGLTPVLLEHSMNHRETDSLLHNHLHDLMSCEALFVQWDGIAGVLMQSLTSYGIKIPEQISILGYNDFPINSYFRPSLASYRDSRVHQCKNAVNHLIGIINGYTSKLIRSSLSGTVIPRDSIKKTLFR